MARSTLELLLESIKERDEEPPDHLPALPQRPTSRARLPSRNRTSVLHCISEHPYGHTQYQPLHAADFSRHHNNGDMHSEAHLANCNGDEFSPTFQNSQRRQEIGNGDRSTQDDEQIKAVEPQTSTKRNRANDNGGLVESPLRPKKQGPALAYLRLKKRRLHHLYGFQKDSRVWFLNEENSWVLGIIQSAGDLDLPVVCLADDKLVEIPYERLLPANPKFLDEVDDLVQLSYIHEPAVLEVLQRRYELGMFCTRAGSSCIVLTPPKRGSVQSCSHTSRQSPLKESNSMAVGSKWLPLLAVTDIAHDFLKKDWKNQSIIISGECSAGRTKSTQAVLKHLVYQGKNDELGNTLMKCNMILEAFGNAIITNGASASQYGKLVDINFDKGGNICSAHVQILLFEKSRVVSRAEREQSYHIFYQLCEGADDSLREKLKLRDIKHFNYLSRSTSANGPYVHSDFQSLLNAFNTLGFTTKNQQDIFSLLGAILWLGNITSTDTDNNEAVDSAANLLNCSKKDLLEALSNGGPDSENVYVARDALACTLYERLFNWVVAQTNKALKPKTASDSKLIRVLDMPGFILSKRDGFESLMVNYAQEHLQHFTRWHLLRQGEEVTACGGLRSHTTNSSLDDERIRFLEHDLLPLLVKHEGNALLESSESGFLRSIERLLAGSSCCKQSQSETFTVTHASGEATYNVGSFVKETKAFLNCRSSRILHSCMGSLMEKADINENGISMQQSLLSIGQERVLQMMQQLEDTEPHFIFCMAPSESKLTRTFEQGYVLQQLRINKMIEAVGLCRSGYLISSPHGLFASRFGLLLGSDIRKVHDALGMSAAVLQRLRIPSYMYQMGWTNIFLCSELVDRLEHARKLFLNNITSIQKNFRGFRIRKQLERQKVAVTHLQASVRGWLSRRGISLPDENKAESESSVNEYEEGAKLGIEHAKQVLVPSQDSLEDENPLVKEKTDAALSIDRASSNGCLASSHKEECLPKERRNIMQVKSVHGTVERLQTTDVNLALKKKEEEITLLHQSVKEYERRWIAYEAKMKSMEEMWQKQVTSLELRLSVATKGSNTEESAYKTGDSDKGVVISTPAHYASTRDTPETMSGDPDVPLAKSELDPSRSVLDHLSKELEHRTQVFNDDARFLVEVKSGQIAANFKPDEELQKLGQRFEVWKKDYKGMLKETKVILKKLGKPEAAETNRKRWWSRR